MNFKPLGRKCLVKVDEAVKDNSCFYIPESLDDDNFKIAEVIAVGPGELNNDNKLKEPVLSVGQKVILLKMVGNSIKVNDEDYLVINDTDALGVLVEE